MKLTQLTLSALMTLAATAAMSATPSYALSMKDCSAKYAAAKAGGSSGAKSWNEFRKLECGADVDSAVKPAVTPPVKPAKATTAIPNAPAAKTAAAQPSKAASKMLPSQTAIAAGAVFPSVIAATYAQQSAGKARMHTCLDQYEANKPKNANGGLKWIEKGGGYYSVCNKRLKGDA